MSSARTRGLSRCEEAASSGATRTSVGFQQARIEILPQFSVEPNVSFNWVNLPQGDFTQHVAATRVSYSFSPRVFLSGLIQYSTSSDSFSYESATALGVRPGQRNLRRIH